jgi:signal transduction histidine kinase
MGFLEIALDTLENKKTMGPEDKMLIDKPLKALSDSSALIDNVRKLQRLMEEGVKTTPIDLSEILKGLNARSFCPEGRDITINIQPVPHFMVEANELLNDVFSNLITNAIKHSDREKPLMVNVFVEPANVDGRMYYRCIVEDNGPGIPDELKKKLFHRFQRGTTTAHGKGLGLYLVRTLVEGYNGRVGVEDRIPGDHTKGAKFIVMLQASE